MTTRTSRPISGSTVAGPASTDIVDIGDGYFAEIRDDGIAISHVRGGLDMAMGAETAMVREIIALRVELDALKVDIANVLTDLTDYSIENDALRARVAELQADNTSLLALVADIRCALGDNGKRMREQGIEIGTISGLSKKGDAEIYRHIKRAP